MKTKILLMAVASSMMMGLTTSCSDFLEEDNKVGTTADLTYSTQAGIDGLVANCYTFARGWYGKEAALGLSEMGTDLFYYGYDNKQKSLLKYDITPAALESNNSDNACLDQYWELFYSATDVCNNAIKYVNEASFLSEAQKQQYLAEAYFMRAFYYFHMVNIWGAVPYNDAPVTAQNMTPTRMPENEVYGKVLNDLDAAIDLFDKARYTTKKDGRANYWAAKAMRSRVLLYAASWLGGQLNQTVKGGDYDGKGKEDLYRAAQADAEAVIGATDYASLYSNYEDVWDMNNESYNTNQEALFGITYSSDLTTTANCIPYRFRQEDGDPMQYNGLITRTGYARGGSAMLLMFVSMWNNGADDLGGNGTKNTCVFVRAKDTKSLTITSKKTGQPVEVAEKYSPYGRGFTRYLPTTHLWKLLEAHKATDQRCEATLLDHYDIASPDLSQNAEHYPLLQDTAIYYCPMDGNSPEGKKMAAYAHNRYRIQFMAGGDIPVYTSMDDATALPTETAVKSSPYDADDEAWGAKNKKPGYRRYNNFKIGGWCSFPGLKKFLDNRYNPSYPTHDISSRDAIVMRMPEMYLIKAECQLALGDAGAAMQTINDLRSVRAKAGQDNTLSGNATLDTILEERAIELCGEQMRWFDLKRTGKLHEYVEKYNAQASPNIKKDTSKHYLYRPIPQNECDAVQNFTTEPNSTTGFWQNPGYN